MVHPIEVVSSHLSDRLRVAAIDFLNPAPLMWDFEHPPAMTLLAERYSLQYMRPARCAEELLAGRADLGLIPIAALTPELAVVPGCTIASLEQVRSIQLIVKAPHTIGSVRTIAADNASRSSVAYTQVLFRRFLGIEPEYRVAPADPIAMLEEADSALLIGDPALFALEAKQQIEAAVGPCQWFDIAAEWIRHTGLPWVAAVWAIRPEALERTGTAARQLVDDLVASRDHGLRHIEDLVAEWDPRMALPAETIRHYLTRNIHYTLTPECIRTIELFRRYALEVDALPPLGPLRFLEC